VQVRRDAGSASEFEMLQAEVARDNQIPEVTRARSARDLGYLELKRLCNLRGDQPIALTLNLLEDPLDSAALALPDTAALMDGAGGNRGVAALQQMLDARGHAITVAASDRWPELGVFANLSHQAFPNGTIPDHGDWVRDKNVGVSLNWSVFDGFLTKGAIEEAKANRNAAAQDLAQARENIQTAITQGILELGRSRDELNSRARTVQLAKRALDLANLRHEEGAGSLLEAADARIAWQLALGNEAQARRDYFAALALLERFSGRPLFSDLAARNPR
jgi:outer membrane protein TolC